MKRSFTQKAAAAASSLAAISLATQETNAEIVHVDNMPLSLNLAAPVDTQVDWDIDGDGVRDFFLDQSGYFIDLDNYVVVTTSVTASGTVTNSIPANGIGFVNTAPTITTTGGYVSNANFIVNLPAGLNVGPTLPAGYFLGAVTSSARTLISVNTNLGIPIDNGFGYGNVGFVNGVDGFAGFSFLANGTDENFGWARLNIDLDTGTATILEWAYEDTGAGIAVGNTGAAAIPEPHSLALIAMGAAGIAGWRQRRRRRVSAEE